MDLQITQVDPVTGVVSIGIPPVPRRLSGLEKLTQIVALTLLRDPGKDVLMPEEGAGIRAMIGQYNFTDLGELQADVTQKIATVESQILANQPVDAPASERLKKLSVQDIAYDEITRDLYVRIRLLNEADASADVIV